MGNKIKLTTYLAGFIEADTKNCSGWRNEFKKKINHDDLVYYDPVERETQKTGKPSGEHVKYVVGLKQSGNWNLFMKEMDKIWLGILKPAPANLMNVIKFLRTRKEVDGNELRDLEFWGDFEAVTRADFIVAYIDNRIQTIGTIAEITVAMFLQIPIYLIINTPKTNTNSSLLYFTLYSGGEVFYDIDKCAEYIKNKYNLR